MTDTTDDNVSTKQHCISQTPSHAGVTYAVHLRLVGKRVVDFLLMLTELFSPAVTDEALCADIDRNRCVQCSKGQWVTLSENFRRSGASPTNDC